MSAWDLFFVVLVAGLALAGSIKGLVSQVLSLLAWVVAYGAAQWFSPVWADAYPLAEPGSRLNSAVAWTGTFFAAMIVWALISWAIKAMVQATPLALPDRLLGGVLGAGKGILVGLVIATFVRLTPLAQSPAWAASRGAQSLQTMLMVMAPMLPASLARWMPPATPYTGPERNGDFHSGEVDTP